MGLGPREPQRKQFYLTMRAKTDKKVDPHFDVAFRADAVTTKMKPTREVSGYLARIHHGEYEWEKKIVKTIMLFLVEGDESFKVESSIDSFLARNLMNSILSLRDKPIGMIQIGVYIKDEYPKIWIKNDGQQVSWKHSLEVQDKLVYEVEDPEDETKMRKVYKKLNAMLLDEWIQMEPYVAQLAQKNENIMLAKKAVPDGAPGTAADHEKALFPEDQQQARQEADNLKKEDFGDEPFGNTDANFLDEPASRGSSSTDDLPF